MISLDTLSECIKRVAILKRRWSEKIIKPCLITIKILRKNIKAVLGKLRLSSIVALPSSKHDLL